MALKTFKDDLASAAAKVKEHAVERISHLRRGDSDGEAVVTFTHATLPSALRIQALATDVDNYPDANCFMFFTDTDNVPNRITSTLSELQNFSYGMRIMELVHMISRQLESALASPHSDAGDQDVASMVASSASDDDEGDDDFSYSVDDEELFGFAPAQPAPSTATFFSKGTWAGLLKRIRNDLRSVRGAGFKVGILCGMERESKTHIVALSIRAKKLLLSEETLQAWDLEPTHYVVLLIRFEGHYRPLERLVELPAIHTKMQFRIGRCANYKPSLASALTAFSMSNSVDGAAKTGKRERSEQATTMSSDFSKLFISNSLDQFMDEKLVSLIKLRHRLCCSWDAANTYILDRTGLSAHHSGPVDGQGEQTELDETPRGNGEGLRGHLRNAPGENDSKHPESLSVPLLAMECAMHYFTKCTEYCLNCHRPLGENFGALKPYVCSSPLCLYQYMALGFGPNVEHEIITQPMVVDLLVSFCYSSIHPVRKIREFPTGLQLKVPNLGNFCNVESTPIDIRSNHEGPLLGLEVMEASSKELGVLRRFRNSKLVVIPTSGAGSADGMSQMICYHGVIEELSEETGEFKIVMTGRSYQSHGEATSTNVNPGVPVKTPRGGPQKASEDGFKGYKMLVYDVDFDGLSSHEKGIAMRHILDTIPSTSSMRSHLMNNPHRSLESIPGLTGTAASLLRWIVSSNRSCIFQVDVPDAMGASMTGAKGTSGGSIKTRPHEKIPGMDGWVQFRFVQGSPDKELKFKRALQQTSGQKPVQYPTIFAWHGSQLGNWHSILRTGLDFKETTNGRAFGHGVYFSTHFGTSVGYCNSFGGLGGCSGTQLVWPQSMLRITHAISLNEIINAPDKFISREPHIVVSQLDWLQCRYLFVSGSGKGATPGLPVVSYGTPPPATQSKAPVTPPFPVLTHDPYYTPTGPNGSVLKLPQAAVAWYDVDDRGPKAVASKKSADWVKAVETTDEDTDDEAFLFTDDDDDDEADGGREAKKQRLSLDSSTDLACVRDVASERPMTPASNDGPKTDFRPGSLDLSKLPKLKEPAYATPRGLRSIQREVKSLQKTQSTTPLHELGWYINFDAMDNLFQWIVELHSFEPKTPLARDMEKAEVTSVVMEVRFGPDFPMSPPFCRIIKPRFLPFLQGGGGHVTAGGALCMELLTSSGWTPANSMESVFMQIRLAMCSDPPARLQPGGALQSYGIHEAIDAFTRSANTHGWKVPPDLRATTADGF